MAAPFAPDDPELERHDRFIRGLARVLMLDPHRADDVAQSTWLAALTHRPPADGLRAWLATLVRHFASNARRSAARVTRREQQAAREEQAPSAADIREREATRHAIVEAVLALEEPYRTTIVLRHLEGHPPRGVARRMGVPVETVRTRTRRALEQLRERLDGEHGSREAWCTALLPVARAPGGAGVVGTLTSIAGALMVTTKTKLAVAALCAMALSFAFWQGLGGTPEQETGVVAHAGLTPQKAAQVADSRTTSSAFSRSEVAVEDSKATTGALLVRVEWEDDHSPGAGIGLVIGPRGISEPMFAERVVHTDERGEARVASLPPGPVQLSIDRDANPKTANLEAGRRTEIAVTLDTGYAVRGIVVAPDGAPVGGAEVLLGSDRQVVAGRSAPDGTFVLRGLVDAQFLAARAPGYAPSPRLQMFWGKGASVPARITLTQRAGGVAGRVHDAQGQPIANAIVQLGEATSATGPSGADGLQRGAPAPALLRSDAEGRFASAMVPTGRQNVLARAPGNALWRGEVTIAADAESTLDIGLEPGATVFGGVRDARGEPAADVEVRSGEVLGLAAVQALSAKDGGYELRGLAPGAAQLTFTTSGRGKARAKVTVLAGERVRCDVRLDAGLQLVGRVQDQRGVAVAGVTIEGLSVAPERWSDHALTDAQGRFRLVNCNDAPTRLLVSSARAGLQKHAIRDARPGPDEVAITLADVSAPSAYVMGSILGPDGAPCCGAMVLLFGLGGGDRLRTFSDPRTAAFRLGPATPGRYLLTVALQGQAMLNLGPEVLRDGETWDLGALRFPAAGTLDVHAAGPDQLPLPRGSWMVASADGSRASLTLVDGRGQCLLAPGAYVLQTGFGAYADQDVAFTVESGRTRDLEVVLANGTTQVLRVKLPKGDPSERVQFVVRSEQPAVTLHRALSSTSGWDELKLCLAPGRYDVEAKADSGVRAHREIVVADGGKAEAVLLVLE